MSAIARLMLNHPLRFILLLTLLVGMHISWEYFHYGEVIAHHPLADENLPAISNWWGLLSIPLMSWLLVYLIQRRVTKKSTSNDSPSGNIVNQRIAYRFLSGLLFGLLISMLWVFRMEVVLSYVIFLPILLALVLPVYLPEYYLGFLIGMMYSFGGVLPIGIGFVLLLLSFLVYKLVQGGLHLIRSNTR